MNAVLNLTDGKKETVSLIERTENDVIYVTMPEGIDYSKIETISFGVDFLVPFNGDDGYFVIPHGNTGAGDSIICCFNGKEDAELITQGPIMTMFGAIYPNKSFMAVVTGMTYDYELVSKVDKSRYYIYPRFLIHGETPYEDISVQYHFIKKEGADYNDVAKAYRDYQIKRGVIKPIRERIKANPILEYAKDSIYVRIRQGWKPVPTPVLEQTVENEPVMKVACTFDDVKELIKKFKLQGIDNAEFCLVGWNVRGHDGRWPQTFPVEPALGGEEKLKDLIRKAKEMGYNIVCHTNSTDAYSIADIWDPEDIIKDKQGNLEKNDASWSGGEMYHLCAEPALKQAKEILPKVAGLGFSGIHYIDVISTVQPRTCYNPKHPLSARGSTEKLCEIMELSKRLFGGISSEGGFDYTASCLDFGLYISFGEKKTPLADKTIPLWQIAYHGYIMSNPYTTTVNPNKKDMLKIIEYGGRPSIYFYSQFVTPSETRGNWMGSEDYLCSTPEERKESTSNIKNVYETYKKISYLQTEFIENHKQIADNVYQVTYSDGSIVTVDYNNETYDVTLDKK